MSYEEIDGTTSPFPVSFGGASCTAVRYSILLDTALKLMEIPHTYLAP